MKFFKREKQTALEAISYAQWIAHAPMVFQSSRVMRNTGVLTALQDSGEEGISFNALMEKTGLPLYGLRVLLESGMGSGILIEESGKYFLTKTGYFILNDEMTRVNMDFVHDVCYKGLYYLEDSINHQKPEGLKVFGDWKSVYEALSELP
ncbi:MAG: SAM-dependent methyltransferase, partial [Crocinitomicaceae bacterium]|nr:SAM-dependent methyltransferase [Crocinitomicaceae bacterium]